VKPLLLRDEEPPDDTVVVVRGGLMASEFVRRSATFAHDEHGLYLLSVHVAVHGDVARLCVEEPYLTRCGQVRLSTVGRLHGTGFALIATQATPHFDLVLPDLVASTLDRLESSFDPPVPNPGRAGGGVA
jgi:hypothetical protein